VQSCALFYCGDTGKDREKFWQTLSWCAKQSGVVLPNEPEYADVKKDTTEVWMSFLDNWLRNRGPIEFVIVILPSDLEERYNGIKHMLTTKYATASQCVKST
jgi:hypothetical protein